MANKRVAKKQANRVVEKKEKTTENKIASNTRVEVKKPEEKPKTTFRVSAYAITAMIYALISGALTIISMTMWIKPGYYFLESRLGKGMDVYALDILYEASFSTQLPKRVGILFVVIGICSVISTVVSIVMMARTTNQEKKPMVSGAVLCMAFAALIVAGFFAAATDMQNTFNSAQIADMATVEKSFGLYYGMVLCVIFNAVVAAVQLLITVISARKWNQKAA
ncbi:MAG: hypothetical protein PUA62_10680 [Lachnospiraceae bacterium]|nr:hypothetical protein [Lachnospiraceae bacterium]